MDQGIKKRVRHHVASREPYKRWSTFEMTKIVKQIHSGKIGIRAASRQYGICRPTLQKWINRISVANLEEDLSKQMLSVMNEDKQNEVLKLKVKELARALEASQLKVLSLQTIIEDAEETLKIKIRKKAGSKQSGK